MEVLLSNYVDVNNIQKDSFHRCYFRQGIASTVETWPCKARYARYVMITIPSTIENFLTLCEVQVFGSEANSKGKVFQCKKTCSKCRIPQPLLPYMKGAPNKNEKLVDHYRKCAHRLQ